MTQTNEIAWNSERIATIFRSPDKARKLVIMVHGGPGGSKDGPANLFSVLEAQLNSFDYATCRFDFRGSGESSGTFEDVTLCSLKGDLMRVRSWCAEKLDVPIILLGESLGATVAMMAVTDYKAPLVLLWPAIDLRDTSFQSFMTSAALDTLSTQGFLKEDGIKISHSFIDECMMLNLWPKIEHFKGKYFIAHGEEDRDVPCSQSDLLAEKLGPLCNYVRLPRAGHGAKDVDAQQKVVTAVVRWAQTLESQ
jgi:pimeloyl-ACP methyl ester carboxylesterase